MKIIVGIIICILVEELCEVLYKRTSIYRAAYEQTKRIKNVPQNLEIVNIGSGPAYYGIDYKYCERNGYNLATAPQNFIYGFRLLKHYNRHIQVGAKVLITILAPMSFGENKDIYRRDYSDRYYGVLDPNDIDGYSVWRKIVIFHPFAARVVKTIEGKVFKNKNEKSITGIIDIWTKEFELTDLKDVSKAIAHKDTFNKKIELLCELIDYCYSNDWEPILVTPPIPEKIRREISDEFLKVFVYDNIQQIKNKKNTIRYLNYYDDQMFNDSCFRSDIFLNEKGKEVFSRRLFKEIFEKGEV